MARTPQPPSVYALADVDTLGEDNTPGAVATLARAGVGWIQIRDKSTPDDRLYRLVAACFDALSRCRPDAPEEGRGHAPALWMNDRADLAALFPFAGLHLGQQDLPPGAARRVVGDQVWIGASCHTRAELDAALEDPEVDLVAVGPVFTTTGKADPDPVVGLDFVARAHRAAVRAGKPLVAIGGIDAERIPRVLRAGADSVAVLGAVCGPSSPEAGADPDPVGRAARSLLAAADACQQEGGP